MTTPERSHPAPPGYDFWDHQLEALGDRDPVEVLAGTPDALEEVLAGQPEERLARRPRPDAWSPLEIVGHLIDTEWVLGFRARTIRSDPSPSFHGIDQDAWVERQRWTERASGELLEQFRALRSVTVAFWRSVEPGELDRTGRHAGAGVELTLGLLGRIHAGHDLRHRDQLQRHLRTLSDRP